MSFNSELRENIILSETAISDKIDDEMVFEIVEKNFGANFLKKINKFSNDTKNLVKTTTIDNLCEINKLENVSFIKIDVEGMEIEVLNGAKNLINKNRSSIFVEVNEKSILKGSFFSTNN